MPTYRHTLGTGKRFHRIHIPRTGGRYFHENIQINKWIPEQVFESVHIEGVEIRHFHRQLYEEHLNINGIPSIAIVRHPISRFIASSMFLTAFHKLNLEGQSDLQELMESDGFFEIMNNMGCYDSEMVNWFRPQVDFLSEDTHVWKIEDGLGYEFGEWVGKILKVPFSMYKTSYLPLQFLDESDRLTATPELIKNIRKYYSEDFKKLSYD